jgi:hypothetical protein
MAVTQKTLIPSNQMENAQTTQYTAVNCKALIDKFTVVNTSAANQIFSVNLVSAGGAAGASNLIIKDRTIAPNETYKCPELIGKLLESGGFISTIAGAATSLTIEANGREIT